MMSHSCQGSSAPKDTHRQSGKQDEAYTEERHSSQPHMSSENNQGEDFSEGHSLLMRHNKNQKQQPTTDRLPFRQGYASKDSHHKEYNQSSSHSQQQNLVTFRQGYPPDDDSPLNHQNSYPFHQQQSSTRISTSQEYSSKDDHPEEYLPNTQSTYNPLPQQLSDGATSLQEQGQPPRNDSLYNLRHQLSPGRVHSPPKDNYPKWHNQGFHHSKEQPFPVVAPSPPKNHQLQQNNQSFYQSHQQPYPVKGPSPSPQRCLPEENSTVRFEDSKHIHRQQPSECSLGELPKQVHPLKHSSIPTTELSNTSCMQKDSMNNYDPQKSQSPSLKDHSAQGYEAPPKSEGHENAYHKNVATQKDVGTSKVESSPKNIRPPRTQTKDSSSCNCCII